VIRLGLNVPNFGPTTTPTALRSWIEFAEAAEFSLAMMSDHVALTADVTAMYPAPFYDPFATLSRPAHRPSASRIRRCGSEAWARPQSSGPPPIAPTSASQRSTTGWLWRRSRRAPTKSSPPVLNRDLTTCRFDGPAAGHVGPLRTIGHVAGGGGAGALRQGEHEIPLSSTACVIACQRHCYAVVSVANDPGEWLGPGRR
jgi:hypothetical protein